jgi:hypothetical protein
MMHGQKNNNYYFTLAPRCKCVTNDSITLTFKLFVFCTFSSTPTAEQGTYQNIVLLVLVERKGQCAEAQNAASKCSTFNRETQPVQRTASCGNLESMGLSNKEMKKESE